MKLRGRINAPVLFILTLCALFFYLLLSAQRFLVQSLAINEQRHNLLIILHELHEEQVSRMVLANTNHDRSPLADSSRIEDDRIQTATQLMTLLDAKNAAFLSTYDSESQKMFVAGQAIESALGERDIHQLMSAWLAREHDVRQALSAMDRLGEAQTVGLIPTGTVLASAVRTVFSQGNLSGVRALLSTPDGSISLVWVFFLAFILVSFIFLYITSYYSRRLSVIAGVANEIAAGRADRRIADLPAGPIGDLGSGVNALAAALQRYTSKYQEDLYKEVEQKTAALKFDRRRMTEIIEGSTDGIAAIDRDFTFMAFNRVYEHEFRKMYGRKLAVGMHLLDDALIEHPDEVQVVKDLWSRALRGEEFIVSKEVDNENSGHHYFEVAYNPIRDEHGEVIGASQIMRDITERKMVEEDLRHAKERIEEEAQNARKFQLAVESSTDAIAITTADTVLIYVNPAWEQLTGYSRDEVIGKKASILKTDLTNPKLFDEIRSAIKTGKQFHTEDLVNRRKDGTAFSAELTLYPIIKDSVVQLFVGILHDISQRKNVERAQTEFVSLASHQLRTPLTAIRLAIGALSRGEAGSVDTEGQDTLKRGMEYAVHMAETIHTMLNISRLEAGKLNVQATDVNLAALITETSFDYKIECERRHQTLTTTCPPDLVLQTDAPLLKEIIANLLGNAIKYTPDSGAISIDAFVHDDKVNILVKDSGYGIPQQQKDKIFTKFFRADNVLQKETSGTGLGLYLVRSLAFKLGGSVSFTSEENAGTTFTIALPLAQTPSHPTV